MRPFAVAGRAGRRRRRSSRRSNGRRKGGGDGMIWAVRDESGRGEDGFVRADVRGLDGCTGRVCVRCWGGWVRVFL